MKVTGAGGASSAAGARPARPGAVSGGGFAVAPATTAAETSGPAAVAGVSQVASLDALLALQEVGGPLERRRRAVGRAGNILDALERLKLGLLEGALNPEAIETLSRAVREQRAATEDPRLESLLDEIEVRAAVELAKLHHSQVAA